MHYGCKEALLTLFWLTVSRTAGEAITIADNGYSGITIRIAGDIAEDNTIIDNLVVSSKIIPVNLLEELGGRSN